MRACAGPADATAGSGTGEVRSTSRAVRGRLRGRLEEATADVEILAGPAGVFVCVDFAVSLTSCVVAATLAGALATVGPCLLAFDVIFNSGGAFAGAGALLVVAGRGATVLCEDVVACRSPAEEEDARTLLAVCSVVLAEVDLWASSRTRGDAVSVRW